MWTVVTLTGCLLFGEESDEGSPSLLGDADADGFTVEEGDCDDTDDSVYPGANDEPYDGVDADCDGESDFDADADGFDALAHGGEDCDDSRPEVNPLANEICNGVDDDCDDAVDASDDDLVDGFVRYADVDGDGFGDPDQPVTRCEESDGFVLDATDCDDGHDAAYPGAVTIPCDGVDNDCDPSTVEPVVITLDGEPRPSLSDAAGDAVDGSVIEVCEGVIPAAGIVIGANGVVLRGMGIENTVLDAQRMDRVLRLDGDDVRVESLTLTGGDAGAIAEFETGGGLFVAGASASLVDVAVHDNRTLAGQGAGIFLDESTSLTLDRVAITDNETQDDQYGWAGGIEARPGASITAIDTEIRGNRGVWAGGVRLDEATFEGNGSTRIHGNFAPSNGGGVVLSRGASMSGVEVENNTSIDGVGGISSSVGGGSVTDVTIRANMGDPPAIIVLEGPFDATRLTVTDHTLLASASDCRCILWLTGPGTITFRDSVIRSNEVQDPFGSAIRLQGAGSDPVYFEALNTDWGTGATENLPTDIARPGPHDFVGVVPEVSCVEVSGGPSVCE